MAGLYGRIQSYSSFEDPAAPRIEIKHALASLGVYPKTIEIFEKKIGIISCESLPIYKLSVFLSIGWLHRNCFWSPEPKKIL